MNSDLRTWMHVLKSESVSEEALQSVLNNFYTFSSDTIDVAENKSDTAMVYYLILCACQKLYNKEEDDIPPENVRNYLITCFKNIERLFLEADESQPNGSRVRLIWFLSQLHTKAETEGANEIDRHELGSIAKELLDILADIRFIFDLRDGEKMLFPIKQVIASVIDGRDFRDFRNGIQIEDICILQLAVRLFHADQEREILKTLRKQYNLGFIDYLKENCEILDTQDFQNYKRNHTMIFHDPREHRILIRSEREHYFDGHENYHHDLWTERDESNKAIGWFVEYPLDPQDRLIDYSEMLQNEEDRIALLRLFYDKGYRNIFIQNTIVKNQNRGYMPVNPYCGNDEFLIKGRLRRENGKSFSPNSLRELLTKYRICPVKTSVMNRITFGLCTLLLNIHNTGVDTLGLDHLTDDRWYQEHVIENWLSHSGTNAEHVTILLSEWYKQLRYCESRKNLAIQDLQVQDFLPLRQDTFGIAKRLCPELLPDERLFSGIMIEKEDDPGEYEIDIRSQSTVAGEAEKKDDHYIKVDWRNLKITDDSVNKDPQSGSEIWFFYSTTDETGHVLNRSSLKALAGIEKIQKLSLSFQVGKCVTSAAYDKTIERMRLFQTEFADVAGTTKIAKEDDFDNQAYLRILYNMIWSGIDTEEKVRTYFDIILEHQIVDFTGIEEDPVFKLSDQNTLYVPKDAYKQGSVLSSVYEERLKSKCQRPENSLYEDEIKIEDGRYTVQGNPIQHIILLTDNMANGSSTITTLAAYLGIETTEKDEQKLARIRNAKERIKKYTCEDKAVSVTDIINRNNADISVHAYYGTEQARITIDSFLQENGIPFNPTTYVMELANLADEEWITRANSIWTDREKGNIQPGHYLYIRAHSMPKSTIFPKTMLQHPMRVINLFVQKSELR